MTYAKLILLTLPMIVSACSLGQPDVPRSVSGIVLDKHTGKPLNGVKVSIEVKRKGRSGIGFEGLYAPKVWGVYSQHTGDLVDPDGWSGTRREIGVFRFDLKQFYNADKVYNHLTVSKLIAEKSGYQSVTIEYPKREVIIHLRAAMKNGVSDIDLAPVSGGGSARTLEMEK